MESSLRSIFLRVKLLQPAAGAISKSYLPRSRVRARENDEHEDGGGADAQGRRRIDHEEQQMEEG